MLGKRLPYKYNLHRDKRTDDENLFCDYINNKSLPKSASIEMFMPDIFDQGQVGSCSANSGVAFRMYYLILTGVYLHYKKIELGDKYNEETVVNNYWNDEKQDIPYLYAYIIKQNNGVLDANVIKDVKNDVPLLSRLALYYEERELEGTTNEDSGATIKDLTISLINKGVCEEKYFPYVESTFTEPISAEGVANALKYKVKNAHRITSIDEIKQAISMGLYVIIGISIYSSFEDESVAESGIIPMPNIKSEEYLGGHCMGLIAYDDEPIQKLGCIRKLINNIFRKNEKGYFLDRNSWGSLWGISGNCKIPYDVFEVIKQDIWVITK